jgi:microcystin-dependent protein
MKALRMVACVLFVIVGMAVIVAFSAPKTDTMPVGTIVAWAGETNAVPAGWMICDGRVLVQNKYRALYTAIGRSWGGTGNKFNLPDLRGRFMRGVDGNTGRDPDAGDRGAANQGGNTAGVGSVQDDSIQEHAHYQPPHSHDYVTHDHFIAVTGTGTGTSAIWNYIDTRTTATASPAISGATKYKTKSGIKKGEETRPKNADVYFIIKVK